MGFWDAVTSDGPYANTPRYRQITTPTPRHSNFYRPDALPDAQPCQSAEGLVFCTHSGRNLLLADVT